ncbi:MAG: ParA family protein [Anaerolineae bacterium]|nr:ParA family protein [Anaerolineae bacterium]
MAKVITFSIYKGGTGKTTSAVNTAAALAEAGKRVLLIDLDQQAQATKYVGIDPDTSPLNIAQVFIQNVPIRLAIQKTAFGFDVVGASDVLSAVEAMLESGKDEGLLREKVEALSADYDFILLDTPPGKDKLTFNALIAAQQIIVPVSAEKAAIDGLADLIKHLHTVLWPKYGLDQDIRILFTMYKAGTSHSPGIVNSARKIYRENVLSVVIPEAIAFPRSYDARQPMTIFAPSHAGTLAYRDLASWLQT